MAKIGFRFKLTVVFILFTLAILMPTVSLIYEVSIKKQTKELKDRILGIVNLSASSIDVNAISKIKPAMFYSGRDKDKTGLCDGHLFTINTEINLATQIGCIRHVAPDKTAYLIIIMGMFRMFTRK